MTTMVTQSKLKRLFEYDKLTGCFIRKVARGGQKVGDTAGHLRQNGYVVIRIDKVDCYAHRLAWLYEFGMIPDGEIDHKNGNRSDNRIENLRSVTRQQNSFNKLKLNRKLEPVGVYFDKSQSSYKAIIRIDGKNVHLGRFGDVDLAKKAYIQAKEIYHVI